MHSATEQKKAIAMHAAQLLRQQAQGTVLGMGTGSTINYLIDYLAPYAQEFAGAIPSSIASAQKLQAIGLTIIDTHQVQNIDIYIDGADEINVHGEMIKGGGGALTREKIVASMAQQFICLADQSKLVNHLGAFAIPIEVLPIAAPLVACTLLQHYPQAQCTVRKNGDSPYITDNQAYILDIAGLHLSAETLPAKTFEAFCKNMVGVIEVGVFARHKAQQLITVHDQKITRFAFD